MLEKAKDEIDNKGDDEIQNILEKVRSIKSSQWFASCWNLTYLVKC